MFRWQTWRRHGLQVALVGQLGTLASMTVFVVDQLVPLVPGIRNWHVALGMSLAVAPLCCLRTTDALPFQLAMQAGSAAVITAMVTLVWYGASHGGIQPAEVATLTKFDPTGLASAFSISAMMYSVRACVLACVRLKLSARPACPSVRPGSCKFKLSPGGGAGAALLALLGTHGERLD
eukprot:SAG22_NODE_1785_length_3588_cov_10.712525_3_plen_178_part_00